MNELYLVASVGKWNRNLFESKTKDDRAKWAYVESPDELEDYLRENSPRYIFFPHWRWIVPTYIVKKFKCVCFHMTDLPYGRGGSPLQNLIIRGHKNTLLTALQMDEGVDTGPIYFKESLSLEGNAQEIYHRAAELTWVMIRRLIEENPKTTPQKGKVVAFKRRLQADSELPELGSLEEIYDFIRMLDAPGYPHAFIQKNKYTISFNNARITNKELSAKVVIKLKDLDNE